MNIPQVETLLRSQTDGIAVCNRLGNMARLKRHHFEVYIKFLKNYIMSPPTLISKNVGNTR